VSWCASSWRLLLVRLFCVMWGKKKKKKKI
jgi:hypothetical protein